MVSINSNVKEEIENLERLANAYKSIDKIEMYNVERVATELHCSLASARTFMQRPDFPLIKVGKKLQVEKFAFWSYLQGRRVCDD